MSLERLPESLLITIGKHPVQLLNKLGSRPETIRKRLEPYALAFCPVRAYLIDNGWENADVGFRRFSPKKNWVLPLPSPIRRYIRENSHPLC